MNVNDLYTKTKQLMFEKGSSTIYDNYLIGNVNRVIEECFEWNNNERMFKGLPPLKEVPYVQTRDDELVYEDIYLNHIMPLGLASYFLIDDDLSKYSIYITDYKNALIQYQKFVPQGVIDGFTTNA
jgi:hypothetical protein